MYRSFILLRDLPPKIAHLVSRGQNVKDVSNGEVAEFAKINKYFSIRKLYHFCGSSGGTTKHFFEFLMVPPNCRTIIHTKILKFPNPYFLEEMSVFLTLCIVPFQQKFRESTFQFTQ